MGTVKHKSSNLYLECFLVVSFFSLTYGLAKFTQTPPPDVYVSKGNSARFVWNYSVNDKTSEFELVSPIWYYYNESYMIGQENGLKQWKFQIRTDTCPTRLIKPSVRVLKESTATLVIDNVTTEDNGIYGCELRIKTADDNIISKVNLVVTETPKFIATPNATTFVIEKTDLKVSCWAIGPPEPNITWVEINGDNTIGKEQARGRGSVMLIKKSITRKLQGKKYMCLARNNPNQSPVNATTTITVYYAPEIEKTFEEKSYCINDEAELNCKADGRPQPTLKWTGPSRKGDSSVFKFKIEDEEEFGNYTCVANNSVGSDKYVVRLIKTNVTCQPPVTKPTPSPTDDVHPGIIAGVVIAAILAIAGLIIAIIFWKRGKLLTKDSEERNERSVRMNAIGDDDNVYATTQQSNREAPDRAQPTVQYAAVDKSKKTKKKRPGEGELIYADLDHETPAGERPPSDRRSTGGSGDQPTLYADIGSTRQETPRYGNLQDMDSM